MEEIMDGDLDARDQSENAEVGIAFVLSVGGDGTLTLWSEAKVSRMISIL